MMVEEKVELKIIKVVAEPRLSLKRFSQYMVASERRKSSILRGCKYPGDYIPKFYEMARKLVCDTFAANFEDSDLYFEEFKKQAQVYRNEAKEYPENKDGYKNRIYSANGLNAICTMSSLLTPVLDKYTVNSNLTHRRDSITKNGVRIGAMADMLIYDDVGATQVGFLKFNFTAKKMSKVEADTMLFVLQEFFSKKGVKLNPKSCFIVDVFDSRIFTAASMSGIETDVDKNILEIRENWDLL
ncbi:hypothetical protein [Parapedobacter tibetensis]|uniref:hypothetical protein n=1 Tax=Parapedobacter tibetensis TaxID=2972951 RepID=UPI00214DD18F|nr:hypothetical protein [Parapedobacter tibetensis]